MPVSKASVLSFFMRRPSSHRVEPFLMKKTGSGPGKSSRGAAKVGRKRKRTSDQDASELPSELDGAGGSAPAPPSEPASGAGGGAADGSFASGRYPKRRRKGADRFMESKYGQEMM